MYSLSKNGKETLTGIVNTILYCQINLNDAAQKSEWKRYNTTRKDLYKAILRLKDEFGVETIGSKAAKENLHESNS
jgi:hypothetical protein